MAAQEEGAGGDPQLPNSDADGPDFTPETLDRSLVALPLIKAIEKQGLDVYYDVIVDVSTDYHEGRDAAKEIAQRLLDSVEPGAVNAFKSDLTDNYLFARVTGQDVRDFASLIEQQAAKAEAVGAAPATRRPVHRIWLDEKLKKQTNASVPIIKASAAHNAFSASGQDIIWAVADSGIDGSHPHFATHATLDLPSPLQHADFTLSQAALGAASALQDRLGHGTHVAGIIAGEVTDKPVPGSGNRRVTIHATSRRRNEAGGVETDVVEGIERMTGVAPKAKLLSLKVLDDNGQGLSSNLIAALAYVQQLNSNGRRLRVHGINMSVGYDFDPEWFACGQSPLCIEVNRAVKSGVSVVVAAGNTGYGWVQIANATARQAGLDLTINDPGNADLAITVGSTHRDMPHTYGVSYFSSKGPTGDGRLKPDMVAPGEKILSCRSALAPQDSDAAAPAAQEGEVIAEYREDSGTSMAAPHVSGAIAAFLSVRREFIGRPEEVKIIFMESATDLKRDRHFQGAGLLDLMRALQSV